MNDQVTQTAAARKLAQALASRPPFPQDVNIESDRRMLMQLADAGAISDACFIAILRGMIDHYGRIVGRETYVSHEEVQTGEIGELPIWTVLSHQKLTPRGTEAASFRDELVILMRIISCVSPTSDRLDTNTN